MAFTVPDAEQFKARFPCFDGVGNETVEAAISEAQTRVDDSWIDQANFDQGILLYAAHVLTLDGHGTGAEAEMARAGALGFTSMKSGQLSLTRGSGGAEQSDAGSLKSTQYGARFLKVLKLNIPGVAVA